jgi:hypothetical protein
MRDSRRRCAPAWPPSEQTPLMSTADASIQPASDGLGPTFDVRSVTGACYTIVEETGSDGQPLYRTAYARLPVVANDDGTFTIVDTRTRLVRVERRR